MFWLLAFFGFIGLILAFCLQVVKFLQLPSEELQLPKNFWWFLALVIVGFQVFIYGTNANTSLPAVGLAGFFALISIGWWPIIIKKNKNLWLSLIVTSASLLSSIFVLWRSNGFLQTINLVVWLMAQVFLTVTISQNTWSNSLKQFCAQLFSWAIKTAGNSVRLIFTPKIWMSLSTKRAGSLVKTVLVVILVSGFFIIIFTNADPVFAQLTKHLSINSTGRIVSSLTIALLVTAGLWQTQKSILPPIKKPIDQPSVFSYRDLLAGLVSALLVSLVFIGIQFRYLFFGSMELLQKLDLTYSQYARQGFYQLLIAVVVGSGLIYLGAVLSRQLFDKTANNKRRQLVLSIISWLLLLAMALILLSAAKRDWLYITTYGLTRVRLVGGFVLGLLTSWLVFMGFLRPTTQSKEKKLIIASLVAALTFWVGLNVVNLDSLVARWSPRHQQYVDYFYLFQLSEDTASAWPALTSSMLEDIAKLTKKDKLTEKELWQLANYHLGLKTIREKTSKLSLKTLDLQILEKNPMLFRSSSQKEIALILETIQQNKSNFTQEKYQFQPSQFGASNLSEELNDDQVATDAPTKIQQEQSAAFLSFEYNWLLIERNWRYQTIAQQQAAQILKANLPLFTVELETSWQGLNNYIAQHQLDLTDKENTLLYSFSYPLVQIKIDTLPNQ